MFTLSIVYERIEEFQLGANNIVMYGIMFPLCPWSDENTHPLWVICFMRVLFYIHFAIAY